MQTPINVIRVDDRGAGDLVGTFNFADVPTIGDYVTISSPMLDGGAPSRFIGRHVEHNIGSSVGELTIHVRRG